MTDDTAEEQIEDAIHDYYSALFVYAQANGDRGVRISSLEAVTDQDYEYEVVEQDSDAIEQSYTGTVVQEGAEWVVEPDHDETPTRED
ncbi:hypothetical protein [Haloarcula argentinensis]|uniref:Uncharacterized protein n=1 Tax=Haloarcula argentinensis TaxID=43776 RepID=A0A830FR84_HALAR|nr:hypothetical protein [Haloarcula argentinensis]EMA18003.1 hypothetical protein C443_19972 [Haloarcula argentinensis DSM 12282]MDS0255742.1 hypothetical protein [Haloarcula argentinensis]GGM49013.1 hypothetical protein GCM10009006_32860 [Haloarcula argentinensis]